MIWIQLDGRSFLRVWDLEVDQKRFTPGASGRSLCLVGLV